MDLAGRVPGRQAAAQVPRLGGLGLACGEKGDLVEQLERAADDALQTRLGNAELGPQGGGILGLELAEL